MSKLLDHLQHIMLFYSKRRFKVYRIFETRQAFISRSLVILDVKRGRFFEIYHDETGTYDQLDDFERAKRERMTDLSDLSICISRLVFDAFFYGWMSGIPSGASLKEAIDRASSNRTVWDEHVRASGLNAKVEDRSDEHQSEGLRPNLKVSRNDNATSLDDMIRRLSLDVEAKLGRQRVYWLTVWRGENGSEHQVLTFDPH